MKIVSNGPSIDGEARKALEGMGTSQQINWDKFQAALDAYRDAAYWARYRDAKDEILESFIKGEK